MIVLTDGLSDPVPVEVAVAVATRAKDAGIALFTVGLGQDVDVPALSAMAGRPAYSYLAPDAADLAAIYRVQDPVQSRILLSKRPIVANNLLLRRRDVDGRDA
jgi:hypothetical protein